MAISEEQRHDLHDVLRDKLGRESAGVLMELVPTHDRDQLATKTDVAVLGSELRAEMSDLRSEMGDLRGDLHSEMGNIRAEMGALRGDMGELRGEMGELRGDMGELRGEMGELRGDMDQRFAQILSEISSQTRQLTMGLVGFSVATWGALLGGAILT